MNSSGPFNRILVAIDSHGAALHALERAAELAAKSNARLELVHAAEDVPPMTSHIAPEESEHNQAVLLAAARQQVTVMLERECSDLKTESPLHQNLHVYPGNAARAILDHAASCHAGLIVLGPHAKQALLDFGRTATAVLGHAEVPVWVQSQGTGPVKTIVVPVDFSEHTRLALEHAGDMAKIYGADVRVVHCFSPPTFAYANIGEAYASATYVVDDQRNDAKERLERLMEDFPWGSIKASSEFLEGSTIPTLLSSLQPNDLIVIGTHGRTGLSRFMLGSVASSIVKRCAQPVLVVPSKERSYLLDVEPGRPHDSHSSGSKESPTTTQV